MQSLVGEARAGEWRASRNARSKPNEAQTLSRSFAEASRLGAGTSEIAILDAEGRIIGVDQGWRRSVALRDGWIGARYADVVGRLLDEADRDALGLGLQGLLLGGREEMSRTCLLRGPDGPRWRRIQVRPLSMGAGRFVAIHGEVEQSGGVPEATSQQLFQARDEERQRIALELHDSTGQHLAAIGLGLMQLRRATTPDDFAGAIIDDIARLADQAVKETRALSYLIRPLGVGPEGLTAALRLFLDGFARRTGLDVVLNAAEAADRAPSGLQHAALRIVQEALMNTHRHAGARRVSVDLGIERGVLTVSVADDGQGILAGDGGGPPPGVGLPGMRARAQAFGGDLKIVSDGSGARVVATLPLAGATEASRATPAGSPGRTGRRSW